MAPANVTRLQLDQIARQEQDAIIFDASSLQSVSAESEVFLIFYLSKEDEYNGYGTVIQLDPQTKLAAIYADLNPEYTYLFYQNEQNELQTLLWCIEIATRTSDGLFIAHAKTYGRGINQEDLQRFSQVDLPQNQPETARQLAEVHTPQPGPTPTSPTPTVATPNQPTVPRTEPAANTPNTLGASNNPVNNPATANLLDPTPSVVANSPALAASAPVTPQPVQPVAASTGNTLTQLAATPAAPQPDHTVPSIPITTVAPTAAAPAKPLSLVEDDLEEAATELNLPPLPAQFAPPPTPPIPSPTVVKEVSTEAPATTNAPAASPIAEEPVFSDIPDILSAIPPLTPSVSVSPAPNSQATPKQPVGRPPKPLMTDQLWLVSPEDFNWAKSISRMPIEQYKDELREKVIKQIRQNKPGLIEDWQFHGAFEQAFAALCLTYDLIPALRHDILKSLLNGRVIEAVFRNQIGS